MEKKTGILLLACGHRNFGRMAATLAATIRTIDESVQICCLHDGHAVSVLTEGEKALFNLMTELSPYYFMNEDGTFNPLKARMHFYELTPFDRTLCIDVDNVWLQGASATEILSGLAGIPFTIQNSGYTTCDATADSSYCVWASLKEVILAYDIYGERFYKTHGDWIYFEKGAVAKKLFASALRIFMAKPKVKAKFFIGQRMPDELAFSIAMARTKIYPHEDGYVVTTFPQTSKGKSQFTHAYQLAKQFRTISMGGNMNPPHMITNYNILAAAAYKKLALQQPYQWKEKRTFLNDRKTM